MKTCALFISIAAIVCVAGCASFDSMEISGVDGTFYSADSMLKMNFEKDGSNVCKDSDQSVISVVWIGDIKLFILQKDDYFWSRAKAQGIEKDLAPAWSDATTISSRDNNAPKDNVHSYITHTIEFTAVMLSLHDQLASMDHPKSDALDTALSDLDRSLVAGQHIPYHGYICNAGIVSGDLALIDKSKPRASARGS
jgi:hypothetical protein